MHRSLLIFAVIAFVTLGMPRNNAHANANFLVNTTSDHLDGLCDADCSLRDAIVLANVGGGDATITFEPTVFPAAAPAPIVLTMDLPAITANDIAIDASAGGAGVTIDGAALQADGFQNVGFFILNASGTIIRGFTIVNFNEPGLGVGILDQGTGTTIEYSTITDASNTGIARFAPVTGGQLTTYAGNEVSGLGSGYGIWSQGGLLEIRDTRISGVETGILMTQSVIEPVAISGSWIGADWMGIVVVAQGTVVSMIDNTVEGSSATGILAQGDASFSLEGNGILENGTGVLAFSSHTVVVHGGEFVGNTTGLLALTEVDARANYWGSVRGPTAANHPPGDGDPIVTAGDGSALFTPWCPRADAGLCR